MFGGSAGPLRLPLQGNVNGNSLVMFPSGDHCFRVKAKTVINNLEEAVKLLSVKNPSFRKASEDFVESVLSLC